jgi:microcystin-dependent protein
MAIVLDGTTGITTPALNAGNDVGQVATFAMSTAPSGWLKANGATVSRTTYAALFTAIGTTFGAGDGSTTFLLPDLRGEFIRGWDDGRGVDSGRAFGSAQGFATQSHTHYQNMAGGIDPSLRVGSGNDQYAFSTYSQAYFEYDVATLTTGTAGTFAAETRPRNVALLACIKF